MGSAGLEVALGPAEGRSRLLTADLRTRLLVAAIGVPACVGVVYAGGWFFALGLGFVAAVAMWEFSTMFEERGRLTFLYPGAAAAALFPLVFLFFGFAGGGTYGGIILVAIALIAVRRVPPADGPITAAAVTLFGVLYTGGLLSFGVLLREGFSAGLGPLAPTLFFFYPVVVTWAADTAAYFVGRSFGRRQMAPRVSPNKTVEGALGALVAGPVSGLLGIWILPLNGYMASIGFCLLFGFVVAVAAILGDLVESAMKRECEVKDASNLLPGHGGVLDRLDSLLFAIPAAYLFFAVALSF